MNILIMVKKLKEIAVVKNKPLSKSRQTIVDNVDNIIALIANNVSYKNIAERYTEFVKALCSILLIATNIARGKTKL